MNNMTEKNQRRLEKAEKLLRARDYSISELSKAIPYDLKQCRVLVRQLHGREPGEQRRIYVSSWDVTRGARFGRIPRYRWLTNAEADVLQPTTDECRALLAGRTEGPQVMASTHNDLMGALFARRSLCK